MKIGRKAFLLSLGAIFAPIGSIEDKLYLVARLSAERITFEEAKRNTNKRQAYLEQLVRENDLTLVDYIKYDPNLNKDFRNSEYYRYLEGLFRKIGVSMEGKFLYEARDYRAVTPIFKPSIGTKTKVPIFISDSLFEVAQSEDDAKAIIIDYEYEAHVKDVYNGIKVGNFRIDSSNAFSIDDRLILYLTEFNGYFNEVRNRFDRRRNISQKVYNDSYFAVVRYFFEINDLSYEPIKGRDIAEAQVKEFKRLGFNVGAIRREVNFRYKGKDKVGYELFIEYKGKKQILDGKSKVLISSKPQIGFYLYNPDHKDFK